MKARRQTIPILAALVLAAATASAGDGVLEINQASAEAGGITPGDAAGFPVTISQTGSYRLTGNLALPASTGGILIQAANVTLDLGGFAIRGPNVCTGYPVTSCTTTAGPAGIESSAAAYLAVVRNGSVLGAAGFGLYLRGASSSVEQLRVLGAGGSGIDVTPAGRVVDSFSGGNLVYGIAMLDGGEATGNEVRGNKDDGISCGGALGCTVIGNRSFQNGGYGLTIPGPDPAIVSRNLISGNGSGTIAPVGDPPHSLGDNRCNGTPC